MALKDKWVDKIDGVDVNRADDINQVARAVIELEENGVGGSGITAKVETVEGGAKVTVTDENGTTTATVTNGKDGEPGDPGVSPTVSVISITGGHRITITDESGTKTVDVMDGAKGDTGATGAQGPKGDTGAQGPKGDKGDPYTLSEADKVAITASVIESLGGNPVFGYVDANNNIIVSGNLADGSYSVKYEMEDGSTVDIGDLVLTDEPTFADFTNLFDASNAVLNSRTNSSGGTTSHGGVVISNFIDISSKVPFAANTKLYIKGADFDAADTRASKITTYKSKPSSGYSGEYSSQIKSQMTINDEGNGVISVTIDPLNAPSGINYMLLTMRVKDTAITADDIKDIIVTIDEPIYK